MRDLHAPMRLEITMIGDLQSMRSNLTEDVRGRTRLMDELLQALCALCYERILYDAIHARVQSGISNKEQSAASGACEGMCARWKKASNAYCLLL